VTILQPAINATRIISPSNKDKVSKRLFMGAHSASTVPDVLIGKIRLRRFCGQRRRCWRQKARLLPPAHHAAGLPVSA
jgi:hypothetical protein